jgi:hypothetical protein
VRKLWLILAVAIVICGILLLNTQTTRNEPSYGGHPLSYWLTELKTQHQQDRYYGHTMAFWMTGNADPDAPYWDNTNAAGNAAEVAIRAIGTNALPLLIDRIKSRPGRAAQKTKVLAKKLHIRLGAVEEGNQRADEAVYAFGFLGSNAFPAIGILSNMVYNTESYMLARDATDALVHLGDSGVRALVPILAEPSVRWRTTVAYEVVNCRPQDLEMMTAALTKLTNSPNKQLRDVCTANLRLLSRRNRKHQ